MIAARSAESSTGADACRVPPAFVPLPLLGGGHAQTIAGRYFWNGKARLESQRQVIPLDDGDRLCVLTSLPPGWTPGKPVAVLVHGLAGSARAPYVVRLAQRLLAHGIGVARLNLRGAGEGFGLARGMYHAGRSGDLRAVLLWLARQAPRSPVSLVGFSLGGNLALKLAGEASDDPLPGLDCVVAANPPIDLDACARAMGRRENRVYDWNFVRWLRREVDRRHRAFPELGPADLGRVRSVRQFDDCYTAPRNGFASAEDYYRRSSAQALLHRITHTGLVIHAEDDPFVPPDPFRHASFPPRLRLELLRHGGHLGYVSRHRWLGDRRWLDARIASWLRERWEHLLIDRDPALSSAAREQANPEASLSHA
jgi:predicted alpha/beta-fold hydrolase